MTDTTGKANGTAIRVISAQYKKCDSYKDNSGEVGTKHFVHENAPGVYRRKVSAQAGKTPSTLSIIYDHKRAQRELAFIKANRTLEEQRNG